MAERLVQLPVHPSAATRLLIHGSFRRLRQDRRRPRLRGPPAVALPTGDMPLSGLLLQLADETEGLAEGGRQI